MATTLEVTKQHFNVPLLLFSRQLVSAKTSRTGAEALTALEKFRLLSLSLSLFLSFFLSFFLSLSLSFLHQLLTHEKAKRMSER